MSGVKGFLLTVTDRGDPVCCDSKRIEIFFSAARPSLSEGEVIFVGSSLIAVTFDLDLHAGIFF